MCLVLRKLFLKFADLVEDFRGVDTRLVNCVANDWLKVFEADHVVRLLASLMEDDCILVAHLVKRKLVVPAKPLIR